MHAQVDTGEGHESGHDDAEGDPPPSQDESEPGPEGSGRLGMTTREAVVRQGREHLVVHSGRTWQPKEGLQVRIHGAADQQEDTQVEAQPLVSEPVDEGRGRQEEEEASGGGDCHEEGIQEGRGEPLEGFDRVHTEEESPIWLPEEREGS